MRLYIIRHAESVANGKYLSGQIDVDLTERGEAQAAAIAAKLEEVPFDAVYTSDLTRARRTAEAILGKRDLQLQITKNLRERAFGSWEGLTFEDVENQYPKEWEEFKTQGFNVKIPDGEDFHAFYDRIVGEVTSIIEAYGADTDTKVCIVAHGCVLMVLYSYFVFGDLTGYYKFTFDNAKVNIVDLMAGTPVIRALNA